MILFYADDILIAHNALRNVQLSSNILSQYFTSNFLFKTKALKLRNSVKLAWSDQFLIDNIPINFVNSYTYLGAVLTHSTKNNQHLRQRKTTSISVTYRKAVVAVKSINQCNSIVPSCTYGLQHLIIEDEQLHNFLKRMHFL